MALPNVASYGKNVIKSISYSAVDLAKSEMPTVAAYFDNESNRELSRSIYAAVKDYKGTVGRAKSVIRGSKIYEAAELGVKSAIDDIRTGKYYNKERINALEDKAASEWMGSFDDMEINMDLSEDSDITTGDQMIAGAVEVSSAKSATMISETQIKATQALIKTQKANTQLMYQQGAQILGGLKEVAFVGTQTQSAIASLTHIQKTATENSRTYYETTTKIFQENNAILKEMLEMQRAVYKGNQNTEKDRKKESKVSFGDVIGTDGEIDFSTYFKSIKQNTKSTISSKTGGMFDMLTGEQGSAILQSMAASPLQGISNFLIRTLLPAGFKGAAKNLDSTVSGLSSTMIAKFNKMGKNEDGNIISQIIGQIFGIKDRTKSTLDGSKYNKGAVPFDGIARKTLVDVIPTYLRRIESAISGQPERIYDLHTGKWTNIRAIKSSYDSMRNSSKNSANSELLQELQNIIGSKGSAKWADKYSKDAFTDALNKMLDKIYQDDGDINFKKSDSYELGIDSELYNQIALLIAGKDTTKGMKKARQKHANEVMSAKQMLQTRMEQMEENADSVFFQLFNGSTDAKKMSTPKYEDSPKSFGGALELNAQKDDLGHNIFYYLQNMYKELYSLRSGSGFGVSDPNGRFNPGRRFNPSVASIPDQHKRTAKEEYGTRQNNARNKYDAEIAKHTEKGGKLYDITDARGNILKDRATIEQLELLERIESMNETRGFINDFLYGNKTKLDETNKSRTKNGENVIDAKKFADRFKATKNLTEKWAVIQDQVNKITRKPGEIAQSLLEKADARLYSFFYGDYTGEEDENGNKIKGFMSLMSSKMNATFDRMNDFLSEKIFDPIKKRLGIENAKDIFDKIGITPIFESMKNKLFGEKDGDGKRQGGVFGDIREEIKHVFGNAKDYVVDSIKSVFEPITSRIKNAAANRAQYRRNSYNANGDLTGSEDIGEDTLINRINSNANNNRSNPISPRTNPREVMEADRRALINHVQLYANRIADPNIKNFMLDMVTRITDAKSSADFSGLKDEYMEYALGVLEVGDSEVIGFIIRIFDRLIKFYDKHNPLGDDMLKYYRKAANKANKHKNKIGKKNKNDTVRRPKIQGPANNYEDAMKISTDLNSLLDFGDVDSLAEVIMQIAGNDPKTSKDILKNMTAGDIFNVSKDNSYLAAFNKYLEQYMTSTYKGYDVNIHDVIKRTPQNNGSNAAGSLMAKVHETLDKILLTINSVVHNNAVVVVDRSKVRNRSNNSNRRRRSPQGGGNSREPESEGDPAGDSDGPPPDIGQAAYGAIFKNKATSALSKGEVYGRNGLFAKVPSTGVYDIKAGTTVYPTNKNKAIELAGEQSAISKFASKFGIQSNADGKQRPTRLIGNETWTLGDDNKWHHRVEKVDKSGYDDYVMEPGFMDQTAGVAKGGINQILKGLGFNGLAETSTVDSIDGAIDVVKKYAPKMTANGLLGGAIGLLSGNPLLGATIGAVSGYVQSSEKAKDMLFGTEIKNDEGNVTGRSGGVISKGSQDVIKKYMPNMGKFGVTGAALGLFTPFGLVGGAMLGSAVGWATTNDRIKEELFGKAGDTKSGLISKEFRDKVKSAAPHMAIGATAGLLLGPFGIIGNAILGSGVGLLSTTDEFKNVVFGEERIGENGEKTRDGGLVGALRVNVVDPLKDFAKSFKTNVEDFVINDMINPLKEGIKPIVTELGLLAKGAVGLVPKLIDKLFESTFGRPLQDLVRDYIIAPFSKVAGDAGKIAGGVAKGVISAPFKAVGAVGRSLQSKHIRKGDASYITASERNAFRDEHTGKGILSNIPIIGNSVFGSMGFNPTGYRDKFKDIDQTLAGIEDPEKLKEILDNMTQASAGRGYYKKENRKTGRDFMSKVSAVFPSGISGRIKKGMERKDISIVSQLIRTSTPVKGTELSGAEREELVKLAQQTIETVTDNEKKSNISDDRRSELFENLRASGFKGINEKNINKVRKLVDVEYNAKKGSTKLDTRSDEEKINQDTIADPIIKNASDNADKIVKSLETYLSAMTEIQRLALPQSKQDKKRDRKYKEAVEKARKILTPEAFKLVYPEEAARDEAARDIEDSINANLEARRASDEAAPTNESEDPDGDGTLHQRRRKRGLLGLADRGYKKASGFIKQKTVSAANAFENLKSNDEEDPNIRYEFDPTSNKIRKFIRNQDGWEEASGKDKSNADRAEDEQQKKGILGFAKGIGEKLTGILGIGKKDDDDGEREDSFIVKALKKAAKVLGIGILGATAVAGTGHAAGFAKDTLVPKLKDFWNGTAAPFLKEHLGWVGDKVVDVANKIGKFATELPGKIKDGVSNIWEWFSGTGDFANAGLPVVFETKILPWYLEGFNKFATVFLPPIAKTIVMSIPAVAKGLLTGVLEGIKALFGLKDKKTIPQFNTDYDSLGTSADVTIYNSNSSALSSVPAVRGGSKWWAQKGSGLGEIFAMAKGVNVTVPASGNNKTERTNTRDVLQESINTSSGKDKINSINKSIYNAKEIRQSDGKELYNYQFMPTDVKGNHYDKTGHLTNDNAEEVFNPLDGVASTDDRMFKGASRWLLGGFKGGLGPFGAIKGIGKGLSKLGPLGYLPGKAIQGIGALGQKIAPHSPDLIGRAFKGQNFGSMIHKAGTKLSQSSVRGLASVGESVVSSGLARAGQGAITGDVIERVSPSLTSKIIKFITEGLTNLINSNSVFKFVADGMKAAGKAVDDKIVKKLLDTACGKIVKKVVSAATKGLAKASAAVIAKITATVGTAGIAKIAFAAWDFGSGMAHARDILGITKEQDIGFLERLIAGLLKCANGFLTWGLVPEDLIVDIFIEFLAPLFNIDVEDLNERRKASEEEVKTYNEENGTDMSVAEYNNRNSIGTKIKNAAKSAGGTIVKGAKAIGSGVSKGFNAVKTGATDLYNSVKEKGLSATVSEIGSGIINKGSDVIKNLVGEENFKALSSVMDNIGAIGKNIITGKPKELMSVGSGDNSTVKNLLLIPLKVSGIIPSVVIGGVKKIVEILTPIVKGIANVGIESAQNHSLVFKGMIKGDLKEMILSGNSFVNAEGNIDPSQLISNISTIPAKLGLTIPTLVIGGVKKVIEVLAPIVKSIGNVGIESAKNHSLVFKSMLAGDLKGMMLSGNSFVNSEGLDVSQLISNISTIPAKLALTVPTLVVGAVKSVAKILTPVVGSVIDTGKTTITKLGGIGSMVIGGDPLGIIRSVGDIRNEQGNADVGKVIGSVITGATLPLTVLPATLIAGVKTVGKFVSSAAGAVIDTGKNTITKLGGVGHMIASGDVTGLIGSVGDFRNEEGNVDAGKVIGSVITGATLPFTILPTLAIAAGKKIGELLEKPIAAIKNTYDIYTVNTQEMRKLALDGDLGGVVKFSPKLDEEDSGGPFAFLQKSLSFVNKFTYAPMAAFNLVGKGISSLFGAAKEVDITSMLKDMWQFTNKTKHPDWSAIDNVGKSEDKADVVGNLITSIVRAVVKPIVGLFRKLSFLSDWISKLKGTTEDEVEMELSKESSTETKSGKGKYGRGRVYQKDPKYSNIRFNKGSDSTYQTIGDSGCGPAAAVNAINYAYGTGNNIISAADMAINGGYKERNGGTNPKFFNDYFHQNGLQAKNLHDNKSIKDNLINGNPVVLMGKDSSGGNTPYGPNPHYITAKGLDRNGNIIIDDPESRYGTIKYPASKVLGRSNVAVAASKYGTGKSYDMIYIYKGSNDSISGEGIYTNAKNKIPEELLHKKQPTAPSHKVLIDKIGFLGSTGARWMLDTDIAQYHPSVTKNLSVKPSTNSTTSSSSKIGYIDPLNKKILPASQLANTTNNPAFKISAAQRTRTAFICVPWRNFNVAKFYAECTDGALSAFKTALSTAGITLTEADSTRTVKNILVKIGINLDGYVNFASKIGVYADIKCSELKSANSSLYSQLKTYAKYVSIDLTSAEASNSTVGQICKQFNLFFQGEIQKPANAGKNNKISGTQSSEDIMSSQEYTDFASGESAKPEKKSIFQTLTDSFVDLFNYTDKETGEVKNVLEVFGIGSRSGSSSESQYTANVSSLAQNGDFANGFPFYNQSDPRWGQIPYGKSGSISSSGCGPTSMATVISSYGNTVTPKDTAAWSQNHGFRVEGTGTGWPYFKAIGNEYGINTLQSGPPTENYLLENLRKGYPVITSMKPGDFTTGGHFITLVGVTPDGKIMVNDSAGEKGKARTATPWDPNTVARQAKQTWVFNKSGAGSIGKIKAVTSSTKLTGNNTTQKVWNFLKSKGYNDTAAAAIMGNMQQESGINPTRLQDGMGMKGPNDRGGFGLVQWTSQGRKDGLFALANSRGTNWDDLQTQLDYFWQEVSSGYRGVLPESLNTYTDLTSATARFENVYEKAGKPMMDTRVKYANQHYQTYAGSNSTSYGAGKYYGAGKRKASRYGMAKGIVRNGSITSTFNDPTRSKHNGIDIAGQRGQAVISPVNGVVYRSEYNKTNGNMVVIKDNDGYLYSFCHLESIKVKPGARVAVGTIIGTLGSTGDSFGNHVHYQVTDNNGQFVDPINHRGSASSISPEPRAIGGSDGIDYTELIRIIIELLGTISDNTSQFTKVLATVSAKTGVDVSDIDTTSKSKAISQLQDRLRALDSKHGNRTDLGTSMMGTDTDYLLKAMSAIAAD